MDLGLAGKRAIICASSGGLGRACAEALLDEGAHVVINGRDEARLAAALAELRVRHGERVAAVAGDCTSETGRTALLAACPNPDILLNNSAGPPPLDFSAVTEANWQAAITGNMVGPLLMISDVLPGMIQRRFGRIVNVTSAIVTSPRPHMTLSAGARAGLTASCKAISLDVAKHNVTINNLLPERFDSGRQEYMARAVMQREGVSYEEARRRQVASIAAGRLGDPKEFGATFAFICSQWAGYMSGQNIHLDGGSYAALI
jgi:3-oxoacyl-[acyl-carrier protein] reductase